MSLADGTHLYVEGILVYRTGSYFRPEGAIDHAGDGTPDEALETNTGRASLHNVLTSPFAGVVSDLGQRDLRVGASFSVPFGGQVSWDRNDGFAGNTMYPGAEDGVQRWNIIEGATRLMYMTAAGAYHIRPAKLSVGASFNVIRASIETIRARTPEGTDDLVTANGDLLEGRSLLESSGWAVSLGAGVLYQPKPGLAIGASYQSQPGFGEMKWQGTLTNRFNTTSDTPVEVVQSYPDVFRVGARWRRQNIEVRASADYSRWSKMQYQCLVSMSEADRKCAFNDDGSIDEAAGGAGVLTVIQRKLHDTWGARVGGSYWVGPPLEAFAGLSFDSNAVPDETLEATLIDANKIIATGGLRYAALADRLWITGSFTHVEYARRTSSPRPRDDTTGEPLIQNPSRNPDGAGRYSTRLELLTVGVEYGF